MFGTLSNYEGFKERLALKFPKILFLFPNLSTNFAYLKILNEIRKYNIISMGFVNTSDNPYILDYFIPINNNSIELIKLYFRFLLVYISTINYKYKFNFLKKLVYRIKRNKQNKK
jgi:ribosomal protein S2